ncbi:helix-turn-helix domain-containing protein [Kocuria sp.]|uniref:helix-turn-helix domain-containing protein n=1 Tax=Kocuria sp. TaxID=1871328 RepID=UPI0026DADF57|nr:helix-turn-helix domain-containing protein [Kocuria sp.]
MHLDKDLPIKEVAELTSQSPAVVGRLVRAGYFPGAYKAGMGEGNAPWVIPYSAVQAYRERMQAKVGLVRRAQ